MLEGDPLGALEELARATGGQFPNLLAARKRSERELKKLRAKVSGLEHAENTSVVMFGSWARRAVSC